MPSALSLDNFPDNCILEILKKCMGHEILRFQATSHRLLGLGRLPVLWRHVIETECALVVPKNLADDYDVLQRIYRAIAERSTTPPNWLTYWGLMTDGGLDDEQIEFWVDNMFQGGVTKYYCSQEHRNTDVRCIGVLPVQDISLRRNVEYMKIKRLEMGGHIGCRGGEDGGSGSGPSTKNEDFEVLYDAIVSGLMKKRAQCSKQELAVHTGIKIGRIGDLTCPVSCGVVMFSSINTPEQIFKDTQGLCDLYLSSKSRVADVLGKCMDLESILSACRNQVLPLPIFVCFGVSGEWAEFSRQEEQGADKKPGGAAAAMEKFQPAAWFRFYPRGEDVLDDLHQNRLATEFAALGVQCKQLLQKDGLPLEVPSIDPETESNYTDSSSSASSPPGSVAEHPIDYDGPFAPDVVFPNANQPEEDRVSTQTEDELLSDSLLHANDAGPPVFLDIDGALEVFFDDSFEGLGQCDLMEVPSSDGLRRFFCPARFQGRDVMDIELTQPVLANTACVILNGCENFMEEMGDSHEAPNVDVNFVWMMGKRIPVSGDLPI